MCACVCVCVCVCVHVKVKELVEAPENALNQLNMPLVNLLSTFTDLHHLLMHLGIFQFSCAEVPLCL